jgi:hypothetical protein
MLNQPLLHIIKRGTASIVKRRTPPLACSHLLDQERITRLHLTLTDPLMQTHTRTVIPGALNPLVAMLQLVEHRIHRHHNSVHIHH